MVWRGPMASKALSADVTGTLWPGSGLSGTGYAAGNRDIQLTLAQNIPVTGAVVVVSYAAVSR